MNLHDKVILVTGGSAGIGLETAKQLRAKGARVIVNARNETKLKKIAQEFDLVAVAGDVANEADVKRIYQFIEKEYGQLDALVNNAGYGYFESLENMDLKKFQAVFATNVTGAMLMAR
ncbi:MAG: SDR family NAD(P)-dependent oxidoreductase, partial [Calditrichaeota bacterium]|nr:SDR family NAD(P)-dependent oxidoreductase [Calditrichota bacterium]